MTLHQWFPPREAAEALGIHPRTLKRWRLTKQLAYEKHWRRMSPPSSKVPRYQYHVENIDALLLGP